jgi:heme/copper-type cytochrome/quinol oxidase subunit 4
LQTQAASFFSAVQVAVQLHFGASFFSLAAASSAKETETAIIATIIIANIVFILNLPLLVNQLL